MLGDNRFGNSTETAPNPYPLPPFKTTMATPATTSQHMDDNDRSSVSDNDSVHSPHERNEAAADASKPKPAPGKKTRGRVKIEMQYIQNKLRRYTTFSKRKSGIMKKAYELSTLTGTQVMLLVASETGHVYTFATPKLQPMITSETGKALIQTCLHTPDPSAPGGEYDIRMSVGGYEETDLGYSMNEEESFKAGLESAHLIQSTSMAPLLNSHSVVLPQGMMPMSFATSASLPDQSMGPMMHTHQLPAYSIPPTTSVVSPHSHSSPPSYSPTHSASPQRTFPGSPATVPYSQSMPPPPMMMDELASGSSPMRKSPESHYLHHGFENSPSNSPMAASHFPVRTHSPSHSGLYSGSPTMMSNHSPVAHY